MTIFLEHKQVMTNQLGITALHVFLPVRGDFISEKSQISSFGSSNSSYPSFKKKPKLRPYREANYIDLDTILYYTSRLPKH